MVVWVWARAAYVEVGEGRGPLLSYTPSRPPAPCLTSANAVICSVAAEIGFMVQSVN